MVSNTKVSNSKSLSVDSSIGGNGDIWMRLVSFYSVAALYPQLKIRMLIPEFIRPLANHTFGDRLTILDGREKVNLKYSSLGLRDLYKGFIKGERFILPYQRSIIKDKKEKELKDKINIVLFNLSEQLGLVHIPDWKWITAYQGVLDVIGIDKLKKMDYNAFIQQLTSDYAIVYSRLQNKVPVSADLRLPKDLKDNLLVFPTGTSRQFIPVWWAKQYLPNAYYAFFFKDSEALEFEAAGLKTVKYFKEPGDMIILSHHALWTVSTDSFSSHLLQSASKKCTITLTEVLKSRIVSPAFKGIVVDSEAICHPCLHLDRKNHPLCAAGYSECINWKSDVYSRNILASIPSHI